MSGCKDGSCCGVGENKSEIIIPGTYDQSSPWKFYNHLIREIPEDVLVKGFCVGVNWTYVEAESGFGVSYTLTGGGRPAYNGQLAGLSLRSVAELSKSWNFREACIGVAALNAWYAQPKLLAELGAVIDDGGSESKVERDKKFNPFTKLRERYQGKKVTVVGHFPNVEIMDKETELTVLERDCFDIKDVPDSACEYVLPSQDFVFTTGTTVINKTAPRLLDLSRNAYFVMLGPSVIPSDYLFKWGIDVLAGRVAIEPEGVKLAIAEGRRFGNAIPMFYLEKPQE